MGLYGKGFLYSYQFPRDKVTLHQDDTPIKVTNTTAVTTATVNDVHLYDLAFTNTIIRFDFTDAALWTTGLTGAGSNAAIPVQFNGPVFQGLQNVVNVTMRTNIAGLDQHDLKFTGEKIALDFTGIHASKSSYISLTVSFNDPIKGGDGSDILTGNNWNNSISGGKGDDVLKGYGGADRLDGGLGNDTASYAGGSRGVVASLSNPALNTSDAKGDTYFSIENLTGTRYADKLIGDSAANRIDGGDGNDKLYGGLGRDLLIGGAGRDTFVFDTKIGLTNIDKINDFNVKDDTIWLDDDIFTQLGATGHLTSEAFYLGAAAHDASDRIIYDQASGKLFYDDDGNGAHAAVQFALLNKALSLAATDFDIIG